MIKEADVAPALYKALHTQASPAELCLCNLCKPPLPFSSEFYVTFRQPSCNSPCFVYQKLSKAISLINAF